MQNIFILGDASSDFVKNLITGFLSIKHIKINILSKEYLDVVAPKNIAIRCELSNSQMQEAIQSLLINSNDLVIAINAIEYGYYLSHFIGCTKVLVCTGDDTRFNRNKFQKRQVQLNLALESSDLVCFLNKVHLNEMIGELDKPAILLPYGFKKKVVDLTTNYKSHSNTEIVVIPGGSIKPTLDFLYELDNLSPHQINYSIMVDNVNEYKTYKKNFTFINGYAQKRKPDIVISFELECEQKKYKYYIQNNIPVFLKFHPFNLSEEFSGTTFLFDTVSGLNKKLSSVLNNNEELAEYLRMKHLDYTEENSQEKLVKKLVTRVNQFRNGTLHSLHEDLSVELVDDKEIAVFYYGSVIEKHRLSARPMRVRAMNSHLDQEMPCLDIIGDNKVRARRVSYLEYLLENKKASVSFVYEESLSTPLDINDSNALNTIVKLRSIIQKFKIPYGIFMRDIYQGYSVYKELRPDVYKDLYNCIRNDFTMAASSACKLYIPSESFATESIIRGIVPNKYSDKFEPLPPAIDKRDFLLNLDYVSGSNNVIKIVYTGGLGRFYDFSNFIEALKICQNLPIKFYAYVRKAELHNSRDIYGDFEGLRNVEVREGAFTELALNEQFDLGMCLFENDLYRKMAVPVKVFDYLSLNMPVLVGKNTEASKIIDKYQVGFSIKNTVYDIVKQLIEIVESRTLLKERQERIKEFVEDNTWESRVKKIINDMQPNELKNV